MADRRSMLDRLLTALEHPRVDGVLASADIMEDLVLLGALEDRVAVGTMNRGGLAGATWELDDRFTAYDTEHLVAANLDAGKMLLRIDGRDPGTVPTLARLRPGGRRAQRPADDGDGRADPVHQGHARGKAVWDHDPLQLVKAVGVCAALGGVVGVHLVEDPGDGRHRHRRGDDDAAAAAPRRRAGTRPGGDVRRVGSGRSPSRPCAGSSSAGRCCTRPTVTSTAAVAPAADARRAAPPRRGRRRDRTCGSVCVTDPAARSGIGDADLAMLLTVAGDTPVVLPGRLARRRCRGIGRSPPTSGLDVLRAGGAGRSTPAGTSCVTQRARARRAPAVRRRHRRGRVAAASSSPGGTPCSPASPTGPTCRSTPRSACPAPAAPRSPSPRPRRRAASSRRTSPPATSRSRSAAPVRPPARSPTSWRPACSTAPTS